MLRTLALLASLLVAALPAFAAPAPVITKVDPPNWWASMDHSLFLLVRGENLSGARWALSDPSLHITSQKISPNGHWAMLWLAAPPTTPETISLSATTAAGHAEVRYIFAEKKPASAGFAGFSAKDVIYLIMTDRFADGDLHNDGLLATDDASSAVAESQRVNPRGWHGGDLRGVQNHLEYLHELGVTTVWVTPVYSNEGEAQSYHGYGATDMYKVDPHYGSLADLQKLAAAAHARGMKLILDTVPNHVGPKHPWVSDEPERDWFHGTLAEHHAAAGDFTPLVNPHAAWRDQQWALEGWFANTLPDMNQGNPDVAQYLIQNAIWWTESAGLDGLRIDTFPYVQREFWANFHAQIRAQFPNLTDVGEVFKSDPTITSYFAGGVARDGVGGSIDTGLWTPFDFPTMFALRDVLTKNKPMAELADVLRQDRLYPHPERLVLFLGNHDTPRFLSLDGASPAKLELGFAVLATLRGTPQIYSGDEIAMRGSEDPDNRHDFPGGFQGGDQSAFTAGGRSKDEATMWDYVHSLLQVRAAHPALTGGALQLLHADDSALAFVRTEGQSASPCKANGPEHVLVVMNKASYAREVKFDTADTALAGCAEATSLLPAASTSAASFASGSFSIQIGAEQAVLLSVR